MPAHDFPGQVDVAQYSFAGGMETRFAASKEDTYSHGRNVEIRSGKAQTRRGLARAFPQRVESAIAGFYFNKDDARFNDQATGHNGFWFDTFYFSAFVPFVRLNGSALVKSSAWPDFRFIVCADGLVRVISDGYTALIPTKYQIDPQCRVEFCQAANKVYLYSRQPNFIPMQWDFGPRGFVDVDPPTIAQDPDPTQTGEPGELYWDPMPNLLSPVYAYGRIWGWINDNEIAASDIYDFNNWDVTLRAFPVGFNDGDKPTCLIPYARQYLLASKANSLWIIDGIESDDLGQSLSVLQLASNVGICGHRAIAVDGATAYFMSREGVRRVVINQYGHPMLNDVILSDPIQSVIRRINWAAADSICAATHDNYLLFAIPIDGATTNNAVIAYDMTFGSWVGIWDGPLLRPFSLHVRDGDLIALCNDGAFRKLLACHYQDSCDPTTEFADYRPGYPYYEGECVKYLGVHYRCVTRNEVYDTNSNQVVYQPPTNSDYWVTTDPYDECQIRTELVTRLYQVPDPANDNHPTICEIGFSHIDPEVSLFMLEEEPHEEVQLFDAPFTYAQSLYDIFGADPWDPTNTNLDYETHCRQDYAWYIVNGEFYIPAAGHVMEGLAQHCARFMVISHRKRGVAFKIVNRRGFLRIDYLAFLAMIMTFAHKER